MSTSIVQQMVCDVCTVTGTPGRVAFDVLTSPPKLNTCDAEGNEEGNNAGDKQRFHLRPVVVTVAGDPIGNRPHEGPSQSAISITCSPWNMNNAIRQCGAQVTRDTSCRLDSAE